MANPHQFFSIDPEHDILHVEMRGTWNEDIAHAYVAEYKKIVGRYFAREWACVLDLRKMEMLLSEEFQINTLKALNTWSYIKGLKSMAIVVNEQVRPHLLYQFEEILMDKPDFNSRVLSNPIDARHWLKDEGFIEREDFQSPKTAMMG